MADEHRDQALPDPPHEGEGVTNTPWAAKSIPPAAARALAEAAARRQDQDEKAAALSRSAERGGRGGLDPVRYEDWEIKGRAVDF